MKFLFATIATVSVAPCFTLAREYKLAPKALSVRQGTSFQGGWPIIESSCPSNTTACEGATGSCCPSSTFCYTEGLAGEAVCCPTASDNCYQTANTVPVCADPSATLYVGNYNYFCCTSGQIGVLPNAADDANSGICVESGTNVASTALASLYNGVSGTAAGPTSTPAATPTSAPGTATASTTSAGSTSSAPATAKNDSSKPSSLSVLGLIIGFFLVPFGL